jgi:hypothetical protein
VPFAQQPALSAKIRPIPTLNHGGLERNRDREREYCDCLRALMSKVASKDSKETLHCSFWTFRCAALAEC